MNENEGVRRLVRISVVLSQQAIENKIYVIRDKKVMLDKDLAQLYDVSTKALIQSVKRNLKRFPGDFMYLLTADEVTNLRSQIVTSSWGGRRYLPYANFRRRLPQCHSLCELPEASPTVPPYLPGTILCNRHLNFRRRLPRCHPTKNFRIR